MKKKYKWFLTIFYAFVWIVSLRGIFIKLFVDTLTVSQIINNRISFDWTLEMYLGVLIMPVIVTFSVITILLVLIKKIPKFNLIFPIYYISLISLWILILPLLFSVIVNSIDDLLNKIDVMDQYWIIFVIFNFIFSTVFLWKLWKKKPKTRRCIF